MKFMTHSQVFTIFFIRCLRFLANLVMVIDDTIIISGLFFKILVL